MRLSKGYEVNVFTNCLRFKELICISGLKLNDFILQTTLLEINKFFSISLVEINVIIYTHKNTLLETANALFELNFLVLG